MLRTSLLCCAALPPLPARGAPRARWASSAPARPPSSSPPPPKDTPLLRTNIGIFGAMNVGKSTLMNAMTQQTTSIVDSTPGTTADTKVALMEFHTLGPVKLFDTPGTDEDGDLGRKKRIKAMSNLRESNVVVVVVNPFARSSVSSARDTLAYARQNNATATVLVLLNLNRSMAEPALRSSDPAKLCSEARSALGVPPETPTLRVDLSEAGAGKKVVAWIESHASAHATSTPVLPQHAGIAPGTTVFLNIPMDEETPSGRLLRPQSMIQEALLRNYVNTFAYRMDLRKARSKDAGVRSEEESRFREDVETLSRNGRLKLLVTDSQAMDIVHPWTLDKSGRETVPITTFSVAMINYLSRGKLARFVDGVRVFESLRNGDSVLICEACNHNRILDDIGVTQIPNLIAKRFGPGVTVEHAFGREYQERDLSKYRLVIHCGGCMLDQQKMTARLDEIGSSDVAITNYGMILSYMHHRPSLSRVLRPFGISYD
eukprot:m51a1_g2184 putative hydrogenase maturase protein F (488) ;mRNA; f:108401-110712